MGVPAGAGAAGAPAGTARLVGTDPDRVYCEVERLLTSPRAYETMACAVNPYGDGQAAQRAVAAIEHMFGLGSPPVPFDSGTTAEGANFSLDHAAANVPGSAVRPGLGNVEGWML